MDAFDASRDPVLLHIGYYKTGTTWLQRQVFDRTDCGFAPLCDRSDPDTRRAKAAAKLLLAHEDGTFLNQQDFEADGLAAHIPERLSRSSPGVPVVSDERLSGNPNAGAVDAMAIAGRLREIFSNGRVLMVIRNPAAMIVSHYLQYLKAGGLQPFEAFVAGQYDGKAPGFVWRHFCYDRLIAHYHAVFGSDRVCVLPYEQFVREPARFMEHVYQFAGAGEPPQLDYSTRSNASQPALECRARLLNGLYRSSSLNGFSPWSNGAGRFVARTARKALGMTVFPKTNERVREHLKGQAAAFAEGRYQESNRRTASLTGLDLAALGYET